MGLKQMNSNTRAALLRLFEKFERHGFTDFLSDRAYIRTVYYLRLGKKPDLSDPKGFNEKLQWRKLNDRKPEYTAMADKAAVKDIVAGKIGSEYIIPTLGVWDSFDEIDFDTLPERFVLKCTHDSGGLCICRDKAFFDTAKASEKLTKSLKHNYFSHGREWPYKDIKPRILAEEFVSDGENENLPVYKFFCFHGKPEIIQSIQNDKQPNETIDYFNSEWELLELRQNFPNSPVPAARPENLSEMLDIAARLSQGFDFIRVDLYSVNGQVKFSEYTFYSDSGFAPFYPACRDEELGRLI